MGENFNPLKFIGGLLLIGAGVILSVGSFGILSPLGMVLIGFGIQMAISAFAPALADQHAEFLANTISTQNAVPIIYGKSITGLKRTFIGQNQSDVDWLHVVGIFCHGSTNGLGIESYEQLIVDDLIAVDVGEAFVGTLTVANNDFFDRDLWYDLRWGTDKQGTMQSLNARFPVSFGDFSYGRYLAYGHFAAEWNPDKGIFHGIPNVHAVIKGVKVFDPRDDSIAYTTNPILCVLDYMTSWLYGAGIPLEEIDLTSFETEADYADELISIPDGAGGSVNVPRFETNITLSTKQEVSQNVGLLLTACRGVLIYEEGKFRIFIRKVVTPTTFVFDEDNIIGDIVVTTPGLDTSPNVAIATYVDEADNWAVMDFEWPPSPNQFLEDDNGLRSEMPVDLPGETNRYRARHIAKTMLLEARDSMSVSFTAQEAALELHVGDVVTVDHPALGNLSPIEFWVLGMGILQNGLVSFALRQYNSDAYVAPTLSDIAGGTASEVPDRTDVDDPGSFNVVGTMGCNGSERVLHFSASWTLPTSAAVNRFLIRYREDFAGSEWQFVSVPGDVTTHEWDVSPEVVTGTTDTWRFEITTFNLFGYSGVMSSGVLTPGTSDILVTEQLWNTTTTIDISTLRTAPDGTQITGGDISLSTQDGSSDITMVVNTTGAGGTVYELHTSPTTSFTPGSASLTETVFADKADTSITFQFTPIGVDSGGTYYYRICVKDCWTDTLGESASCSDELNAPYNSGAPSVGTLASCENLIRECGVFCVTGAGDVRGHEYRIDLWNSCLVPGDVISVSAEGSSGGAQFLEISDDNSMAMLNSGFIAFDDFSTDPRTNPDWEFQGSNHLSSSYNAGGKYLQLTPGPQVMVPPYPDQNYQITWVKDGREIILPHTSMQACVYVEWNGDASSDDRLDVQPGISVGDKAGWRGDTIAATWNQVHFTDMVRNAVFSGGGQFSISPLQVSSGGPHWLGIRKEPDPVGGCGVDLDYIQNGVPAGWIGGLNDACMPQMVTEAESRWGPGSEFPCWPGMFGWGRTWDSGTSPALYHEFHAWEKATVEVQNIPANTNIVFEQDTHPRVGPDTVTISNVGPGTVTAGLYDGTGRWPPYDRIILQSWPSATEFARLEPQGQPGVYGGDVYSYNAVTTCESTFLIEFYDEFDVQIGATITATGVFTTVWEYFEEEGVTIPANTDYILIVHQKLGVDDCGDVCIQNVKVNKGLVATPYSDPKLSACDGSLDEVADGITRFASPMEYACVDNGYSQSPSTTIDFISGNIQKVQLNGDTEFVFTNVAAGQRIQFWLENVNGLANNVVWPPAVNFPGGAKPALSSTLGDIDVIELMVCSNGEIMGYKMFAGDFETPPLEVFLEEEAQLGAIFDPIHTFTGTKIVEDVDFGDVYVPNLIQPAAISEGAQLGDTFGAIVIPWFGFVQEDAQLGDTFDAQMILGAAISEGAALGDIQEFTPTMTKTSSGLINDYDFEGPVQDPPPAPWVEQNRNKWKYDGIGRMRFVSNAVDRQGVIEETDVNHDTVFVQTRAMWESGVNTQYMRPLMLRFAFGVSAWDNRSCYEIHVGEDQSGIALNKVTDGSSVEIANVPAGNDFESGLFHTYEFYCADGVQEVYALDADGSDITMDASDTAFDAVNSGLALSYHSGTGFSDDGHWLNMVICTGKAITITNMPAGWKAKIINSSDVVVAQATELASVATINCSRYAEKQATGTGAIEIVPVGGWKALILTDASDVQQDGIANPYPGDVYDSGRDIAPLLEGVAMGETFDATLSAKAALTEGVNLGDEFIADMYVAATSSDSSNADTSVVLTKPAGLRDDDVIYVFTKNNSGGNWSEGGATFTKVREDTWIGIHTIAVFRKVITSAAGEPADYTFNTSASSTQVAGLLLVVRNANTTTPEDVTPTYVLDQNDAQPESPAITPVTDACLILAYCSQSNSNVTFVAPSGFSIEVNTGTTPNTYTAAASKILQVAAADGPFAWLTTGGAGTDDSLLYTVAVRPK